VWRVLLRVIDIETTGLVPPAEVIEIFRVDVNLDESSARIERPMDAFIARSMEFHLRPWRSII